MSHSNYIGAGLQQADCGSSFPRWSSVFGISPSGSIGKFGLFNPPGFITDITDYRHSHHLITAEGSQTLALLNRVGIFYSITQCTCGLECYYLLERKAHIRNQDIDLFGDVNIKGCLSNKMVIVSQGDSS
ncbi:hypothetical protein ES703_115190 [subsurface metagenome]